MQETTINQRLKFLIETLSVSVRAFSESIGESTGNTNNYIGSRQLAPKHEYLAKVLTHFSDVNAHWLLTGTGEPFKEGSTPTQNQTNISGSKNIVASGKGGKAILNNYTLADCEKERDTLRAERDSLAKQVELLHGQLQTKDALIASKEETIELLKAAFNRPN